jgi:5'-3' exonuclease
MVALFDIDSLMYKCCYMLDSEENISKYDLNDKTEDELVSELAGIGYSRLEKKINDILLIIEAQNIIIDPSKVELYITTNHKCFRREIFPQYKANRKNNDLLGKVVKRLRDIYKVSGMAHYSDEWEADDAIADRARKLGDYGYIIIGMDKDFIQLGGLMFNYYSKPALKDKEGNVIEEYPMKGLVYTDRKDADYFFAYQMLVGDSGDNIKGVPKIGKKKSNALLSGKNRFGLIKAVVREYKKVYGEDYIEPLQLNFRLLYLGSY